MENNFEIEIHSDGNYTRLIILTIIAFVIYFLGVLWLKVLSFIIVIGILIWFAKIKKIIRVDEGNFEIISGQYFFEKTKSYSIAKMEAIVFLENVELDLNNSKNKKKYPEIISFNYENKKVELGAGFGKFGAKYIVNQLKIIQGNINELPSHH